MGEFSAALKKTEKAVAPDYTARHGTDFAAGDAVSIGRQRSVVSDILVCDSVRVVGLIPFPFQGPRPSQGAPSRPSHEAARPAPSLKCPCRGRAVPVLVPVPPARPALRAASACYGTPVTPAEVKPLPFGTSDKAALSNVALRSCLLHPRQRTGKQTDPFPQESRPQGSPHSRFYITRALCKLHHCLRSLHPSASSGNPPRSRPPPRGLPDRSRAEDAHRRAQAVRSGAGGGVG